MVPFTYGLDGKIFEVRPAFHRFREPSNPIPPEITALTGITAEMVAGQSIDPAEVADFASGSALVVAHNAAFDRRFLVIDGQGEFITQREQPKMATVWMEIDGGELVFSAPDMESLIVPAAPPELPSRMVHIWSSHVLAHPVSPDADAWLSEFLSESVQLVYMPESSQRRMNPDFAKPEEMVSFADGYPFMLIGQASLDDLNSRLHEPVPMNRFRPNFVVAGAEPFAEDKWRIIRIGSTVFHVVKACERCVMPTVDQATGEKTGKEPLRTLSIYRTFKGKVLFGQNMIAENTGDAIKVGDNIEILERAK
jgi:uncharacterized protein YcbX